MENTGIIERIWQISPALQRLEITVEPSLANLKAGQSVLALTQTNWNPYLREQWTPIDVEDGQFVVERPADDQLAPGQLIHMIGPVGQELPWIGGGNKHLLLIAYDIFPTSLLMLAHEAIRQTAEVALVLLGTAAEYPFAGIPAAVEVMNGTEQGTWPNEASMISWADQIFIAAHPVFYLDHFTMLFHKMKAVRGHIPVNLIYGIFNLPMPCGVGACDACMVRCKTSDRYACIQGPALDLAEVQLI